MTSKIDFLHIFEPDHKCILAN